MTEAKTWATDNRWSPGASGAEIPDNIRAAYGARWIDQGDTRLADVVPDRQGFAYDDRRDQAALIYRLVEADEHLRYLGGLARDETSFVWSGDDWEMFQRRAGGYVYVDAWLFNKED
jgi:hypothetical protein